MLRTWILGITLCVAATSAAAAQSGTLTSNSPCQLAVGQSHCEVTLSWQTSGSPISCLWLSTGALFACTGNGSDSAVWPWTSAEPQVFVLRSHASWDNLQPTAPELARTTVQALAAPVPAGTLTSTSPCTLSGGNTRCDVTLSWTKVHTSIACVWTGGGALFACSANSSDSAVWPWTNQQSEPMILRAHAAWGSISPSDPELARTTVVATAPNVAPQVALVSPASDGFVGLVGQARSLSAQATDSDGAITRVEYRINGAVVSQAYAPPFAATWLPAVSGEVELVARAFDNQGAYADSAVRRLIVAEPGVPSIPATYGRADQFFPMSAANPKRLTFRGVGDTASLYSWAIPYDATTWDFHWPSTNSPTLDLQNTLWERWQVRTGCAGGSEWIYLNSYHGRGPITHDSIVTTSRALLDYGGKIYDVTSVCGGSGQPYVPRNVSGQPHRIRVWGLIAGSRQWYWEASFGYQGAVTNTCWKGGGSQTRPVIQMSEAWWDDNGGWMFGGSGAMGPDGRPNGLGAVHVRSGSIAHTAGYAWSITSGSWNACSVEFADYVFSSDRAK